MNEASSSSLVSVTHPWRSSSCSHRQSPHMCSTFSRMYSDINIRSSYKEGHFSAYSNSIHYQSPHSQSRYITTTKLAHKTSPRVVLMLKWKFRARNIQTHADKPAHWYIHTHTHTHHSTKLSFYEKISWSCRKKRKISIWYARATVSNLILSFRKRYMTNHFSFTTHSYLYILYCIPTPT